jgi:hypothetical protein
MFYGTGLACCALFLKLGTKWPELALLWQRTEHSQIRYGYPANLRKKIRTLTVIVLTLALGMYAILLHQHDPLILDTMMPIGNVDLILLERSDYDLARKIRTELDYDLARKLAQT